VIGRGWRQGWYVATGVGAGASFGGAAGMFWERGESRLSVLYASRDLKFLARGVELRRKSE